MRRYLQLFALLGASTSLALVPAEVGLRMFGLGDPILYKADSLVGFRPRPNQAKTRLRDANITFDRYGFRNTSKKGKDGRFDVLFLGDSVTYGGSYIGDEETFVSLACADTEYMCKNGGINAWGVLNMVRLYANLSHYTTVVPDTVVFVVTPNDDKRNVSRLSGMVFWRTAPWMKLGIVEALNFAVASKVLPAFRGERPEPESLKTEQLAKDTQWREFFHLLGNCSTSNCERFVSSSLSNSR